jgi:hypothetical protein
MSIIKKAVIGIISLPLLVALSYAGWCVRENYRPVIGAITHRSQLLEYPD